MIQVIITIAGDAAAEKPLAVNVGFRAGAPGTEQAVTSDEKVTAAQFMSAVEGVQRVPLVLEKIECTSRIGGSPWRSRCTSSSLFWTYWQYARATGAGSSLIIPGNAGGIAVPR